MFRHAARRKCHVLSWSAAPPVPSPFVRIPHAVSPSCFVPLRSRRRCAERGEHCKWRRSRRRADAANIADGGVDATATAPMRRDPVSRVSRPRARPSAPVSAGAVRAPDCAYARERPSAGRTSLLRFDGIFSRRRRREGKRPPDAASSRQSGRGPFGCQAKLRTISDFCEHRACNAAGNTRNGLPL